MQIYGEWQKNLDSSAGRVEMQAFSVIMSFKTFRRLRIVFRILGFERLSRQHSFGNLHFVFYALLGFSHFTFIRIFWDEILYTLDDLGWVSDEFKFMFIFSTYFMSIYVSWKHQHTIDCIWEKLYELDAFAKSSNFDVDALHRKVLRVYIYKHAVQFLSYVNAVSQHIIFQYHEAQTMRFIANFTWVSYYCQLKNFHAVLYIDLANCYCEVLNEELQQLGVLIKYNETKLFNFNYNVFLYNKLKQCRSCYTNIYKVYELLNDAMKPFFLVNYLNCYVDIMASLYWVVFRILNHETVNTPTSQCNFSFFEAKPSFSNSFRIAFIIHWQNGDSHNSFRIGRRYEELTEDLFIQSAQNYVC